MSLGSTKLNVVPSRAVRVQIKARISLANKGYSLLKAKLDGLTYRFNVLEEELKECNIKMREKFKLAYLALRKLEFLGFDFRSIFCSRPERNPNVTLKTEFENVAGVTIRKFVLRTDSALAFPFAGLDHAGEQVVVVRKEFSELLKEIVEVASRAHMLSLLKTQMKSINTRCNAIEFVVVPRLRHTMAYIESELDEMEREEFYRIKRAKASRMSKKTEESKKESGQNLPHSSSSPNDVNKSDERNEVQKE